MSNENFEVIFAGQIIPGAVLEQVKARVAAIFKTDVAKIAHLFAGSPVVIKKGIDQAMAQKYQAAMKSAGAVCEIRDVSAPATAPAPKPAPAAPGPVVAKPAAPARKPLPSNAPPAPQTAPLSVTADKIADMQASLAPVGSDLHQAKQEVRADIPDIAGLTMAPAGTVLTTHKKETPPPDVDLSGLSIVKN